jgi:hypothetical protein
VDGPQQRGERLVLKDENDSGAWELVQAEALRAAERVTEVGHVAVERDGITQADVEAVVTQLFGQLLDIVGARGHWSSLPARLAVGHEADEAVHLVLARSVVVFGWDHLPQGSLMGHRGRAVRAQEIDGRHEENYDQRNPRGVLLAAEDHKRGVVH